MEDLEPGVLLLPSAPAARFSAGGPPFALSVLFRQCAGQLVTSSAAPAPGRARRVLMSTAPVHRACERPCARDHPTHCY